MTPGRKCKCPLDTQWETQKALVCSTQPNTMTIIAKAQRFILSISISNFVFWWVLCVYMYFAHVCLRFSCTFHFPHLFVLLWFIYLKWASLFSKEGERELGVGWVGRGRWGRQGRRWQGKAVIRICCMKKLFFKKKGRIFRKAKINKNDSSQI